MAKLLILIATIGLSNGMQLSQMALSDWDVHHHQTTHSTGGFPINRTTYTSPVLELMTGAADFTLNPVTHIPFPKGDYTVLASTFQIVDESGSSQTPLSEVYNHHWLIGTQTSLNPLDTCEGTLFFGAGAEMRGMPVIFPKGYGMKRVGAKGWCGGNLHFIRTEDLATNWTGMKDPKGNYHAAVKNCIECGYAPKRSLSCLPGLDGNFACCLTGSRCPVNHPEDRSKKGFRLVYEVEWTPRLDVTKMLHGGVLDVSGGQIEWNVAPNLDNKQANQECTGTVCNITNTWTVGPQKGFKGEICPGRMMWSYLHQHIGAINGTMFINGVPICTSHPIYGTDPHNTPGNELGYVVNFTRCIDTDNLGNAVRLNKGDEVKVQALYDVDPMSTRSHPFPGGKHGGVMALFFYMIDCDPGTYEMEYVCRDATCVPVPVGRGDFKTQAACEKACS